MKSICIKVTKQKTAEYLLEMLNNSNISDIVFSYRKFKVYQNIIIHYTGKNEKSFLKNISNILASLIIDLFENNIIKSLIKSEYFYFDKIEQSQILDITTEDLYDSEESLYSEKYRFNILSNNVYKYLNTSHSLILKGFITFRIKDYLEKILEQIDKSVNKYIIEKEYTEFISLLKIYVNSESSTIDEIHLIYHNFKPILLDKNKNIIDTDDDTLNSKYLSDISFSSNDYALNTLLNLIPKKIYIHLIDDRIDEFISTIKLIFEDRAIYCNNCSICKSYKKSHATQV